MQWTGAVLFFVAIANVSNVVHRCAWPLCVCVCLRWIHIDLPSNGMACGVCVSRTWWNMCCARNDRQRSHSSIIIFVQNTHIIAILMMDGRCGWNSAVFFLFLHSVSWDTVLCLSRNLPLLDLRMARWWVLQCASYCCYLANFTIFIEHLCRWRLFHWLFVLFGVVWMSSKRRWCLHTEICGLLIQSVSDTSWTRDGRKRERERVKRRIECR